jgi:hypothetical protein
MRQVEAIDRLEQAAEPFLYELGMTIGRQPGISPVPWRE